MPSHQIPRHDHERSTRSVLEIRISEFVRKFQGHLYSLVEVTSMYASSGNSALDKGHVRSVFIVEGLVIRSAAVRW